jgi:lipopolysaccharide export system protein LptA
MKPAAKIIVLAVSTAAGWVHALPDDRSKPIEIQANSAERDARSGVTTYSGNVDIRQGSIHVAADTVVLNSKNDELTEIIATGKPATYSQQLSGQNDVVDAKAGKIRFQIDKDLITLQGNGSLKQKGGSISGDYIEYDTKTERVKATAAEAGSADNNRRITVVIPPGKKSASGNSAAAKDNRPAEKEISSP